MRKERSSAGACTNSNCVVALALALALASLALALALALEEAALEAAATLVRAWASMFGLGSTPMTCSKARSSVVAWPCVAQRGRQGVSIGAMNEWMRACMRG